MTIDREEEEKDLGGEGEKIFLPPFLLFVLFAKVMGRTGRNSNGREMRMGKTCISPPPSTLLLQREKRKRGRKMGNNIKRGVFRKEEEEEGSLSPSECDMALLYYSVWR